MKKFAKMVIGGWVGLASWIFAFAAIAICYHLIGGTEGAVTGCVIGKASWIPYLFGVVKQWRAPKSETVVTPKLAA